MKTLITDTKTAKAALAVQKNEVTEYFVYTRLAKLCGDPHNSEVLRAMGEEELAHSRYWQSKTGVEIKPGRFRVFRIIVMARVFGLTFILKRMEKNEGVARGVYQKLVASFPEAQKISEDETEHEQKILAMLDEELLRYVGSIVLGLNDALVELTGALAGFTLALGETRVVSLAGLITGISAAFSMTASDYLSGKAENNPRAVKSALYTGGAYLVTVILLILPFLLLSAPFTALGITLAVAVLIIFFFNYYLSVAKDLNFCRRFLEMTLISLGVALLSFGVGYVLKNVLGIDAA
ncbi:MAG: VIT1/CCC1 family protein [Spirochaetaceae bacterium]|jgi:VIT1/CCC1 family predicted Fe2+/Mn2+ transporter|nr:VIT1/CCC1 family protein [Spirochaetaceae bacterium]